MASEKLLELRKFLPFHRGMHSVVKIFCGIAILHLIQCAQFQKRKLEPPPFLQPVNLGDDMKPSSIAIIRKDGYREISATSPEAMRYIFYRAGCKDGSSLAGLLSHEWKEESKLEKWTGACKSLKSDSIYFKTYGDKDPRKLKEFGTTTIELLKSGEENQNPNFFFKAIEHEPALADARLNLFHYELDRKNCSKAKRHLDIFLILSPGFPGNPSLKKIFTNKCEK